MNEIIHPGIFHSEILNQGSIWFWITVTFLGLALFLYCLLAGADFGAGVLELFLNKNDRQNQRKIIDRALGPVWEANHMWLILIVVILFMGFPSIYTTVSIYLHLPLTAMLFGIIARGCSFTFRHYDAVQGRSQKPYTFFFIFSSIWTPFCLGLVTGALVPGRIHSSASYYSGYIRPWLSPFPIALGAFTVILFALLASIYIIGETPHNSNRQPLILRAKIFSMASVFMGALVFVAAEKDGIHLMQEFLHSPFSSLCLTLATLSLPILWWVFKKNWIWIPRMIAGFQIALILAAWLNIQFPVLIHMQNAADLTFFNSQAPEATLRQLSLALGFGSILILPALYYLFRVFKLEQSPSLEKSPHD